MTETNKQIMAKGLVGGIVLKEWFILYEPDLIYFMEYIELNKN